MGKIILNASKGIEVGGNTDMKPSALVRLD